MIYLKRVVFILFKFRRVETVDEFFPLPYEIYSNDMGFRPAFLCRLWDTRQYVVCQYYDGKFYNVDSQRDWITEDRDELKFTRRRVPLCEK